MIGFTTEINLKEKFVQTDFLGETSSFCFNDRDFTLLDALKVSAEDVEVRLKRRLEALLEHADRCETIFLEPTITRCRLKDGHEGDCQS